MLSKFLKIKRVKIIAPFRLQNCVHDKTKNRYFLKHALIILSRFCVSEALKFGPQDNRSTGNARSALSRSKRPIC